MQAVALNQTDNLATLLRRETKSSPQDLRDHTTLHLTAAAQTANPMIISLPVEARVILKTHDRAGQIHFLLVPTNSTQFHILETLKKIGSDLSIQNNTKSEALLLITLTNSNPRIILFLRQNDT